MSWWSKANDLGETVLFYDEGADEWEEATVKEVARPMANGVRLVRIRKKSLVQFHDTWVPLHRLDYDGKADE